MTARRSATRRCGGLAAAGMVWSLVLGVAIAAAQEPGVREPAGAVVDPASPEDLARATRAQARAMAALKAGDLDAAGEAFAEQAGLDPGNFVPRYNLACVRSRQGRRDEAMAHLVEAVERGFVDVVRLRREGDLGAIRDDPRFVRLLENWPRVLERHLEANLAATRATFTQGQYTETRDADLRIAVLSAMDETSTAQALAELRALKAWGVKHVFPELGDPEKAREDAWTVVVLPTGRDFTRWMFMTYGRAAVTGLSGVGGAYLHDEKRLIAQDLGATLRHEFFHVLHWRSSTRLGQDHPIWIQEGLCSLVEDMAGAGEELRPAPSWRTNVSLRLARGGRLMSIGELSRLPRDRFMGTTPLAHYGQARTVFLYLWERGVLGSWYAHYTGHHAADPTGVASIEHVLGLEGPALERDYRAWVRGLPEVAEQLRPGRATIGVDVDPGTGDGPVIAAIPRDGENRPGAAWRAGLRVGDVITGVNGRATRDLNELLRILGEFEPGDEVRVGYRRGPTRGEATITLVPR